MAQTMLFSVVRLKLFLVLHTKDNPSDEEWESYLRAIKGARGVNGIMIISDGGGPTTMQRGKMNDLLEELKFQGKVAVVTVKSMVRGIVTAISWFNPGIKAFTTLQIPAALKYLDFPESEHGVMLAEIQRLRQKLGME